ncbi:MAG: InlB B-repeat-containing protein, partial [Oscillospiraceae bacterium]
MKKRILSLLLCVIMTLSLLPVGALAVESAEAEWTPSGGEKATGSFADALAAMAASGGSMKLLTDVSTAVATTLPAKEISLDLGGKTWTSGDRTQIPRSGTLNLTDTGTGGKILSTGPSFTVETGGKLNLSGGTIAHNSDASYPALCNSGTVTMSGGTIARSGHDVETVENEGTFSMSGGEITNAAYTGIENGGDLTMTGGSITTAGSGVVNFGTRVTATITGGTITSARGLGINNRSGSTLYLGGTASVTATAGSAVQNLETLYLFGAPTLTKGTNTYAYQIYGDDDTIVASNGKAGGELAYYTGDALDIYFPSSFPANKALVSGIENEAQSKKFNIIIGGGNMMEPVYDDNAKTIIAKRIIYNITYKDRAKAEGGANFSGVHGANAPMTYTAGTKTTLVAPTKEGYTFGGWYERAWGSTDKAVTALKENPYGDKTFYAKWIPDTPTEKTDTPNLTRTIDAASWEGKVYFGLQEGSKYQEHVEYKLYTTADGNDMPDGITVKDEWGDSIKISSITTSTDYWLTATEDGKLESERVKISARAQYTGLDENGYLVIKTPQELADYLNYCEPGAATVSGSTVTFAKDVPLLYDIYFAGNFEGALDLHGFTATVHDGFAFCVEETETNVKFTLKGGGKIAAEDGMYAIAQYAGKVVVENTTLIAGIIAIFSDGGTISLTDVTVKVPKKEVTDSTTLFITPNTNLTIHSGT